MSVIRNPDRSDVAGFDFFGFGFGVVRALAGAALPVAGAGFSPAGALVAVEAGGGVPVVLSVALQAESGMATAKAIPMAKERG
jgi:hypothetical protein